MCISTPAIKFKLKILLFKETTNTTWAFKYPELPSIADKIPSQHMGIYNPNYPSVIATGDDDTYIYNPSELIDKSLFKPTNLHTGYQYIQMPQPLSSLNSTITTSTSTETPIKKTTYKSFETILKTLQ